MKLAKSRELARPAIVSVSAQKNISPKKVLLAEL